MAKQEQIELDRLGEWCNMIINYIAEMSTTDINSKKVTSFFLQTITKTRDRNDLKGMKKLANEISEWGQTLNENQIKELNKKLTDTFGLDLTSVKVFEKIELIINKGKISSLKEYRLMMNFYNDHFSDSNKKEQIEKIGSLIDSYQKETGNF